MNEYRSLLAWVDEWYRGVQRLHPDKVTCTRGCRDCCVGLFDITLADRALLRAGLARADEAVRRDIEERAGNLLARIREKFPRLGGTLAGLTDEEVDELCAWLHDVECPVLGTGNECRLYAHRPLTCRLHGVPVVGLDGEAMHPEGCRKCLLRAEEAPRLDCERLCAEEAWVLARDYGDRAEEGLLIPQAVARDDRAPGAPPR